MQRNYIYLQFIVTVSVKHRQNLSPSTPLERMMAEAEANNKSIWNAAITNWESLKICSSN